MHNSIQQQIQSIGAAARKAALELAAARPGLRQAALNSLAAAVTAARPEIMAANREDLADAERLGLPVPMLKRLEVNDKVFNYIVDRLRAVAEQPDPVGRVLEERKMSGGLQVSRVSVPLGVVAVIYESRPNVTADAAGVCLRSGNAVILRGGSESLRTNLALADALAGALAKSALPAAALQIIRTADREAVDALLGLEAWVDVLIPRGGRGLIEKVARCTRIPLIKHYDGICHLYIAADADPGMAVAVSVNSKCERVEVCNALETLLVEAVGAERLLPALVRAFTERGVELRGCPIARTIIPEMLLATAEDWHTEYLAPILSVRVVENLNAAVEHIRTYGSGHTDGIITANPATAEEFVAAVDSASVLVNASTRLSGGGDYGLGSVLGISTGKLHARGPVGPEQLTSYKWIARGSGHLR